MGEAGCALDAMKLTLEQRLAHSGHPVLLWMMDNIYIRTDPAGNVKADKEKSTEKIDGAVATIIGLDRSAVEIIPVLLSMMTEGSYSYNPCILYLIIRILLSGNPLNVLLFPLFCCNI